MKGTTRFAVAAAGVPALALLAYLVNREWYTLLMMKRMSSLIDPAEAAENLRELVEVLPKGESRKYVILAIQPKMGTSWVGHIAHQLLVHGGDVDPTVNLQVDSPYPDFGDMLFGKKLHKLDDPVYWKREPFATYPDGPVTIRTHVPYAQLKRIHATEKDNFRLVAVFRDPADTVMSMWRFLPTVAGIDYKLVPFPTLMRVISFIGILDQLFVDYADFWERRHDPNVLILFFEDLKDDLAGNVRRLADLLALSPPLTQPEFNQVVNQSGQKFMSSPDVSGRFNEMPRQFKEATWARMGITEKDVKVDFSSVGVVRKGGGKSGDGAKSLPDEVTVILSQKWEQHVRPRTECKDLGEMRRKLKEERTAAYPQ